MSPKCEALRGNKSLFNIWSIVDLINATKLMIANQGYIQDFFSYIEAWVVYKRKVVSLFLKRWGICECESKSASHGGTIDGEGLQYPTTATPPLFQCPPICLGYYLNRPHSGGFALFTRYGSVSARRA